MTNPTLTPPQARVIASLAEKCILTPQYYPMSVNAIMLAANQKSLRNPVMQLKEGEVEACLNQLEQLKLCSRDTLTSRVTKWRQQFQHQFLLKVPEFAVLVTLVLRGPQTRAELRSNAMALGGPDDESSLSAALESLNDRAEPLVVMLAVEPGQKAARFAHCLSGAPESVAFDASPAPRTEGDRRPVSDERVAVLEERVSHLEARIAALERSLGVS